MVLPAGCPAPSSPTTGRITCSPFPLQSETTCSVAYHQRLTGNNDLVRMQAAKAWSVWEGRCSTLDPNPDVVEHFADPHFALAMARIEAHYFIHKAFLESDQILNDAHRLADIPITIVHGRYDVVCPLEQALCPATGGTACRILHIVRDAGHSAFEPGIIDNLVHATDEFVQPQRLRSNIVKGLIQRVSHACVKVDNEITGAIDGGILLLLGVEQGDRAKQQLTSCCKRS